MRMFGSAESGLFSLNYFAEKDLSGSIDTNWFSVNVHISDAQMANRHVIMW